MNARTRLRAALTPARRAGPIVAPVFSLLEGAASSCADPWPLLEAMLAAHDRALGLRAAEVAAGLAESGALDVEQRVARFLAERAEVEGSPLAERAALHAIGRLLRRGQQPSALATDPVLVLYLGESPGSVRRLAARVLDLDGQPAAPDLAARLLGTEPRVAMLSFSNFGSVAHVLARKVRRAAEIAKQRAPDLAVDGEMQVATALNRPLRREYFPFSSLDKDANVPIFPDLQSRHLAMHLLQYVGSALPIGPILVGTRLPAQLLQYGSTVEEVVNLTTVGVVEAAALRKGALGRSSAHATGVSGAIRQVPRQIRPCGARRSPASRSDTRNRFSFGLFNGRGDSRRRTGTEYAIASVRKAGGSASAEIEGGIP